MGDMKLRPWKIWTITGVSVAALAGLVILQYTLIRNAYEVRQQAFERNVHAALNSVAQRLETGEAVGKVFQVALGSPLQGDKMMVVRVETDSTHPKGMGDTLSIMKGSGLFAEPIPLHLQKDAVYYTVPSPQHVTLRVFDLASKKDTLLVDADRQPGEYSVGFAHRDFKGGDIVVKYRADSSTYTLHATNESNASAVRDASVRDRKREIVSRAVENLSQMELQPIEKRVPPSLLDSVVRTALGDAGIDLPFACGVISEKDDSLRIETPPGYGGELRSSSLSNPLFPDDILASRNRLAVFFPGQSTFLLRQVGPILGLTILFMSAVVICFAITIRTIVRQKDFSLRLVEFINNMTHEFKTPISTIGVAVETISRSDVIGLPERVQRYTDVIRDENVRMKDHVDKILQMAVLEEGDFELKLMPVDLNAAIGDAVERSLLQVEAKGGKISCDLGAAPSVVKADPVHTANIIHNILDNANKYSPGAPEIAVRTWNSAHHIHAEVRDRGIGISAQDLGKVFDRYYRVRTGNVHDVKGFGLGLSYVKLMVEALEGDVSIESSPGNGTTVSLRFPLAEGGAE
jgi:two-component system phosphate regulon sensor histidine kinase PhoR